MRPLVVGHRGALYDELENTIESFQRCIQLGCDAIELDVFLLHDGTLIVFHGGRGGDLTDYSTSHPGLGILNLETYEETQTIQFNPDFDEFGCSPHIIRQGRIPTLKEVLLIAKRSGIIVKIELKGPGVTRPVLQLVQELDMVDQCHYSSFDHEQIALVRELHPERITDNKEDGSSSSSSYRYKTGALFDQLPDDFIDQALRVGASEVHLKYDTCTPSVVNAIHTNGMDSMIWMCGPIHMRRDVENKYLDVGNEDETMYATLLETGVRQMCVNRPDVLLNMLSRKG
jgi:glycerophosphoryl diester phosphodiesterase